MLCCPPSSTCRPSFGAYILLCALRLDIGFAYGRPSLIDLMSSDAEHEVEQHGRENDACQQLKCRSEMPPSRRAPIAMGHPHALELLPNVHQILRRLLRNFPGHDRRQMFFTGTHGGAQLSYPRRCLQNKE